MKLSYGENKNKNLTDWQVLSIETYVFWCNRRAGVPVIREDFSMARNVSVTPVQSVSAGEIFRKVSVREEMISRRMRMIDARRVTKSIHRWLLSHLTALCAIARANTSTRADRKQYRALETLILWILRFVRLQTSVKNFYERLYKLFERFNRVYATTICKLLCD